MEDTVRTIQVSDEVWNAIAERGKFGETEDQVLRRVFHIKEAEGMEYKKPVPVGQSKIFTRRRFANNRMSARVRDDGVLIVEFASGQKRSWKLSGKTNKVDIRQVRDEAVVFATEVGASHGQVAAVKKALTEAGYHLAK